MRDDNQMTVLDLLFALAMGLLIWSALYMAGMAVFQAVTG